VKITASATKRFIVFHDISNLSVVKEKYSTIRNYPVEQRASIMTSNCRSTCKAISPWGPLGVFRIDKISIFESNKVCG